MWPKIVLLFVLALMCAGASHGALSLFPMGFPGEWDNKSVVLALVASVDDRPHPHYPIVTLEVRSVITGSLDAGKTPRVISSMPWGGWGDVAMERRPKAGTLVIAVLARPHRPTLPGPYPYGRYFTFVGDWAISTSATTFMPRGEPIFEVGSFEDEAVHETVARIRALRKRAATIDAADAAARATPANPSPQGLGAPAPAAPASSPGKAIALDLAGKATLEMILVRPGTFFMGDDQGNPDEKPARKVTITRPFYLGKCKVTDRQLESLLGPDTAVRKGAPDTSPTWAGWDTSRRFLDRLSGLHVALVAAGKSPNPRGEFRLPTEAEWEYACRAGTTTKYGFGDSDGKLAEYAWHNAQGCKTVGQKKPNRWGLYDMHGDVWEWCSDWYSDDYYRQSPSVDPQGPGEPGLGHARVLRGGGTPCGPAAMRSAFRFWWTTTGGPSCAGLRVAMTAPDEPSLPPDEPAASPAKVDGPKSEKAETREVKK